MMNKEDVSSPDEEYTSSEEEVLDTKDVQMGMTAVLEDHTGQAFIKTTGVATCIGIVVFFVAEYQKNSQSFVSLTHFDSATSCKEAEFSIIEKQEQDTIAVIESIIKAVKNRYQINKGINDQELRQTNFLIQNVAIVGAQESDITKNFIVGCNNIRDKNDNANINPVVISFVKSIKFVLCNLGVSEERLSDPTLYANVCCFMEKKDVKLSIEYYIENKNKKNDFLLIDLQIKLIDNTFFIISKTENYIEMVKELNTLCDEEKTVYEKYVKTFHEKIDHILTSTREQQDQETNVNVKTDEKVSTIDKMTNDLKRKENEETKDSCFKKLKSEISNLKKPNDEINEPQSSNISPPKN